MTYDPSKESDLGASGKVREKYTGVAMPEFELSPSVIICAAAGGVLGLVLSMWATTEIGIVVATTVCFAILSGLFGLFVPWYKPR